MIRRPHQRARLDMRQTEPMTLDGVTIELVGMDVAVDGSMPGRRPQVLADRDDVDPDGPQVGECTEHFGLGLSHSHDEEPSGLNHLARASRVSDRP